MGKCDKTKRKMPKKKREKKPQTKKTNTKQYQAVPSGYALFSPFLRLTSRPVKSVAGGPDRDAIGWACRSAGRINVPRSGMKKSVHDRLMLAVGPGCQSAKRRCMIGDTPSTPGVPTSGAPVPFRPTCTVIRFLTSTYPMRDVPKSIQLESLLWSRDDFVSGLAALTCLLVCCYIRSTSVQTTYAKAGAGAGTARTP